MRTRIWLGPLVLTLSTVFSLEAFAAKSIEEYWQEARTQFDAKDYVGAAKTLVGLVDEHPTHWEARPIGAWFYWEASKRVAGAERTILEKKAEAFILAGLKDNEKSWLYNREVGDFYRLRSGSVAMAYPYYAQSTQYFESASAVQKASLLDRLARSAEELGRVGDAVTASCRALELDPEDKMAKRRIANLSGNCVRKGVNLHLEGEIEVAPQNPKSHEGSSH